MTEDFIDGPSTSMVHIYAHKIVYLDVFEKLFEFDKN